MMVESKLSMVTCLLMVRWVIGLIPHGEPIELFHIPVSMTGVKKGHSMWYPVWDGEYKRILAANWEE